MTNTHNPGPRLGVPGGLPDYTTEGAQGLPAHLAGRAPPQRGVVWAYPPSWWAPPVFFACFGSVPPGRVVLEAISQWPLRTPPQPGKGGARSSLPFVGLDVGFPRLLSVCPPGFLRFCSAVLRALRAILAQHLWSPLNDEKRRGGLVLVWLSGAGPIGSGRSSGRALGLSCAGADCSVGSGSVGSLGSGLYGSVGIRRGPGSCPAGLLAKPQRGPGCRTTRQRR